MSAAIDEFPRRAISRLEQKPQSWEAISPSAGGLEWGDVAAALGHVRKPNGRGGYEQDLAAQGLIRLIWGCERHTLIATAGRVRDTLKPRIVRLQIVIAAILEVDIARVCGLCSGSRFIHHIKTGAHHICPECDGNGRKAWTDKRRRRLAGMSRSEWGQWGRGGYLGVKGHVIFLLESGLNQIKRALR